MARDNVLFSKGRLHHGFMAGAQTGSYGSAIVGGAAALYLGALVIAFMAGGGGDL